MILFFALKISEKLTIGIYSGVDSPHFLRLIDGKRKKWDGAEEAIRNANENVKLIVKGKNELISSTA